MSDQFLSEIRIIAFNYAPQGWALCNGQIMPINQNQALFSLLGTTYGGNGQVTFALPDLRGRVPLHFGGSFNLGQAGGAESHTLTVSEMPTHVHLMTASTVDGSQPVITNSLLGSFNNGYAAPASLAAIAPQTIANVGGSQPHPNNQPFLVLNYMICLQGIFPSPN